MPSLLLLVSGALYQVSLALSQQPHKWTSSGQPRHPHFHDIKVAHGTLACLAWVIFFPLGAILLRRLRASNAVRIHWINQVFAYTMFVAAAGLGIWMASVSRQLDKYHSIIGLLILSLASFQVIAGFVSHCLVRLGRGIRALARGHVWLGRLLITLGIVNGGLGLLLGDDAGMKAYVIYGVVAGLVWLVYVAVSVLAELRKGTEQHNVAKRSSGEIG